MPTKFKTHEEYLGWYRKYRAKNIIHLRKYNREYNRQWRKHKGYHNEKNSIERYPEKVLARQFLAKAVRYKIIKRGNCQICAKPDAQGHHNDYLKPLDVLWFCALHHTEYHKKLKLNMGQTHSQTH